MFTGLIEAVSRVTALTRQSSGAVLSVKTPREFDDVKAGDSIAVSGVCLTALSSSGYAPVLDFDVSPESLSRSTLGRLSPGSRVNLERALRADSRLDGHIVAGHVDATARVIDVKRDGDFWTAHIELLESFSRYVVEKGSIALDGISLTVARIDTSSFSVAVIPQTYAATVIQDWTPGHLVNVEADILGKYVERLLHGFLSRESADRDARLRDLLSG